MAPPNFAGIGKEPGLKIWRVQAFELVDVPKHLYGSFYAGDCYLVLDTYLTADKAIRHNVHYWLGADSSQDEQGSVAVFAVQLDDALGGTPVQFRQTQGQESAEFLQLFPRLKLLSGGFASGFKSAKDQPVQPAKLFQVKSAQKGSVQVYEVPCALDSLNSGDCFLLEDPPSRQLFVFHGSGANIREKTRAVESANAFKDNTGLKMQVVDESDASSAEARAFYALLGVKDLGAGVAIKPADKDKPPPAAVTPPALYLVDGGSFSEVSGPGGKVSRSSLQPDKAFVLHGGGSVWVWVGQDSGLDAGAAFKTGEAFASSHGAGGASVKVVKDRFEPHGFVACVPDWKAAPAPKPGTVKAAIDTDAVVRQMLDAVAASGAEVEAGRAAALLDAVADLPLATSKATVRVQAGSSAMELPGPELGQFYDAESYVVVHAYTTTADPTDKRYITYVWVGRHAEPGSKGGAALTAADTHHKQYAGKSTLVRVAQGSEPAHLVALFKGKYIVRRGSRPKGGAAGRSPPGVHLYQVKAESVTLPHPVEVEAAAASLSSGDCFVLESAGEDQRVVYLWQGAASSAKEQAAAAAAAVALAGDQAVETVAEGSETDAFWSLLGGKGPYASAGSKPAPAGAPRLFHLRDTAAASGSIKVEAYDVFSQEQLAAANTDVVLLDTRRELFLWTGKECQPSERARGREIGAKYLQAIGRTGEEVVEVDAGAEPPFFRVHFAGFDARAPDAAIEDKIKALKAK